MSGDVIACLVFLGVILLVDVIRGDSHERRIRRLEKKP